MAGRTHSGTVDLKKAFRRDDDGVRGEATGREATLEEIEVFADGLCKLVDRGKHDKAATRLVGWLNDAGTPGAGLLTSFLAVNVAQACVDHGMPVDGLNRSAPEISGVDPFAALTATMRAQELVMRMLERASRGESELPTGEELTELWSDEKYGEQLGALAVYYYLQCLANAAHLGRVTGVLFPAAPVDAAPRDSAD